MTVNLPRALFALFCLSLLPALACSSDDDPGPTGIADNPSTGRDAAGDEPDASAEPESDAAQEPAMPDAGAEPSADSGQTQTPTEISDNPEGVDPLPPLSDDVALPIVFVHGFAGSAQQYESQAMRFVANGYPQERILAYDHDGVVGTAAQFADGVDAVIDAALERFGATQVYLVGHSRGTMVSSTYLSTPERAAKVAKYISLDGRPCPADFPCIAPNRAGLPGQAHVEVATSKESFALQYEFLIGEPPEVLDIVAQREPVELRGRAVNFPANTGRAGALLRVFEIDSETGARVSDQPHASFEIDDSGDFGPLHVDSRKHYEFELSAENSPRSHHLYVQRQLRDNFFLRLLSGGPDSTTNMNTNTSDGHTSLIATRMREWYAQGDQADVLEISTSSESAGDVEATNVIVDFVGNAAIGLHLHDDTASAGESSLMRLTAFAGQPFQSGVDVFIPAADPPDGVVTIVNYPRGDRDRPQTFNIPNWPSSKHAVSLVFADFALE